MSALPETPKCPRCGAALERIDGLCPACVARGGLADAGWLEARPAPAGDAPVIPGWKITGTLGAGGMGRVFQAESESDGARAAIKVLDARWTHDPVMAARFEGEAEMLRRLDHPNIVRLLETTETDDGRLCIAMEFVEGCDLGRLLRAEKLRHERAVELFGKVCAAVEYAHAQGFIHRDIKPSNILVGRDGTVKLADFGLAKGLDVAGDLSAIGGLTATTDQFGTAYYLAPERMVPGKACGPQTDVFSLGVLLYHLLTGQMPLGKFTPLSQLTGLPAEMDAIVAHALEANPERRTADVATLRSGFEGVWRDHLAGAFRARKLRRAVLIVVGVIFTAAAAAAGALWQRERMKPPPPPVFAAPSTATIVRPWVNSLGMKFVPVPKTKVLFSIWETRRRDYEPFRAADRGSISQWRSDQAAHVKLADSTIVTFEEGGTLTLVTWEDPGFPVTPDHPAAGIGIRDAQFFCLWLTWREQAGGRLPPGARYRLPTTSEWLTACGGEKAATRPGNLAGPEAGDSHWPASRPTLDVRDPFPRTSPVGSFPPELHGLCDLSGNVCEWVQDKDEPTNFKPIESSAQLRGPSFADGTPQTIAFSYIRMPLRHLRLALAGFRVVLELNEP